jgi:hypothetical protein
MDRDDKGRFLSEGNTGRKKGTINKTTSEIRDSFQMLLENNIDLLEEDIRSLEPKDRIQLLLSLANYILPKLRSIDLKSDVEETITIDFNSEINWKSSDVIDFEDN